MNRFSLVLEPMSQMVVLLLKIKDLFSGASGSILAFSLELSAFCAS